MLVKLIRPFFESGWNATKLICYQKLSTSSILFKQSTSGTYPSGSSKTNDKPSDLKNQQQKSGDKNIPRAESDVEQEQSQQEGPADKGAERKSSDKNDKWNK